MVICAAIVQKTLGVAAATQSIPADTLQGVSLA